MLEALETMERLTLGGCGDCICKGCLWYRSGRCPHGGCYDDRRARVMPWPGRVRDTWSDWDRPGEQAHWCRGGVCYTADRCDRFAAYTGSTARDCLDAVVEVFQDGYIQCSFVDAVGCEECARRFEARQLEKEARGVG